LFCIAAVVAFTLIAAPFAGWAAALIGAYVITLGGITTTLYVMAGPPLHVGIARSTPTIYLGDVLLVGALFAIWAQGGRLKVGWLLMGFVLPSLVLLLVVWGNTPSQWSGLKLYATAIVSFGIGRWLSEEITERSAFVVVCACLVTCGLQFVVAFAQSRGVTLLRVSNDAAHWIGGGRMTGLYSHPALLGRSVFLLFCFLLPLSLCGRSITRRLALVALALGSVATLLTLSRANALAIGVAVILWVILSGRATSILTRLGVIAVAGGLVALNTTAITGLEARQAEDPYGGFRDPILTIGLGQIKRAPLTGTGPNSYTEVVGRYDHFAASGFPLHNSFLYPIAELGIPLGIVLLAPVLITLVQTARRIATRKTLDVRSATLFSVLPGIVVIAWTGWGLMTVEALPLWFMAFGFLSSSNDMLGIDERRASRRETRTGSYNAIFA
jgi:O-antigen ligase